jgi:RNA methyltransferase, TrmH family
LCHNAAVKVRRKRELGRARGSPADSLRQSCSAKLRFEALFGSTGISGSSNRLPKITIQPSCSSSPAVAVPPFTTISSPRNPLIRHALRLRDNRFRQRDGAVIVDGTREIGRALASGLKLRSLFIAASEAVETAQYEHCAEASLVLVAPDVLAQIAYGNNPRGAVAVFDRPQDRTLEHLSLPADPLVVVMVGIEKPGNAGAIFRSADAVGADAVILCQAKCDLFNPNLIRSSLATVFTVPSAEASQAETLRWLGQQKFQCLAAIVGASQTIWDADYRGATAIVLGSEAEGLDAAWRRTPQDDKAECGETDKDARKRDPSGDAAVNLTAVSIPMLGTADSLNVSVTAAALLFEASRQRSGLSR